MANYDSTRSVGQCGCVSCSRFDNSNCDSCLIKIKTMKCDPNNWKEKKGGGGSSVAPMGVDPVRSNIYNGGWLCNYEPQQVQNGVLCKRQFFSAQIQPPFNTVGMVNADSKLKGITTYGNRFCYNYDKK